MPEQNSTASAGEKTKSAPQAATSPAPTRKRKSNRRRRTGIIHLRVDPDEFSRITTNAAGCSLTTADFLRRIGQNIIPPSRMDHQAIRELCRVAGDLGRLGGLLKLWLSQQQDSPQKGFKMAASASEVDELWVDLQKTYRLLKSKIESLT